MLESLFNKVTKKKLQNRCFPVNIAKFFRTPPVPASVVITLPQSVFKTKRVKKNFSKFTGKPL